MIYYTFPQLSALFKIEMVLGVGKFERYRERIMTLNYSHYLREFLRID